MDQSQFRSLGSVSQPHTTGLPGTVQLKKRDFVLGMLYGMSRDEKDASQNCCVYSGVLMNYEHKVEKIPTSFHIHPLYEVTQQQLSCFLPNSHSVIWILGIPPPSIE